MRQFGPDGRLRRTTADPRPERAQAQVAALHDAVTGQLPGLDRVAAELFTP
jgi:hypothetical protein